MVVTSKDAPPFLPVRGKEGYKQLVRLVARAFYSGECPPKDTPDPEGGGPPALRNKAQKADMSGLAVITLDALTKLEWVKEDDLAAQLKMHPKQIRRLLRFLEEEQIVMREHYKETVRRTRKETDADGKATNGKKPVDDDDVIPPKPKVTTHSYCALDYPRFFDVLQLRMYKLRKAWKEELANKSPVQSYMCPTCESEFTSLDALHLLDPITGTFKCEFCKMELVQKFGAGQVGDDDARRQRIAVVRSLVDKAERQFKPLLDQVEFLKKNEIKPPDHGTLMEYRALKNQEKVVRAGGQLRVVGEGADGTEEPHHAFVDWEKVVKIDVATDEDIPSSSAALPDKVLPPWMRAQQQQQAGSSVAPVSLSSFSAAAAPAAEEKKTESKEDKQAAVLKAYYQEAYKKLQLSRGGRGDVKPELKEEQQANKRHKVETPSGWAPVTIKPEPGIKVEIEDTSGVAVQWEEVATTDEAAQQKTEDDGMQWEAAVGDAADLQWETVETPAEENTTNSLPAADDEFEWE